MDSPVSIWACSAQSRENLALSHSCTWQTTCFSFHPHQGNATGKQWCNRDSFRSQRSPEISREIKYQRCQHYPQEQTWLLFILLVRAIPAWVQGAHCSSSCEDHTCQGLLHRSGCSQVHSNKPRASYLQDSSMGWKWVGWGQVMLKAVLRFVFKSLDLFIFTVPL